MARGKLSFPAPFQKGWVRDLSRVQLGMGAAYTLQDAVWTNGVVSRRGPIRRAGSSAPTGDAADTILGVFPWLRSGGSTDLVISYYDNSALNYKVGVIPYGSYDYGDSGTTVSSSTISTLPGAYVPVALYRNEIILAKDNSSFGKLVRYAGAADDATAETGTVALEAGSDVVTGTGTNFTTTLAVGNYVKTNTDTLGPLYYMVTKVESDTIVRISSPASITYTGASWTTEGVGYFNIHSLVTEDGEVSTAPTTTITGVGTSWNTGGLETIAPAADDLIGRTASGSATEYRRISSISNDTTLTVASAPGGAWSTDRYRATRSLVGGAVAIHQGRIWATYPWFDSDRIQVLPQDFGMSTAVNGIDSTITRAIQSRTVESFELEGVRSDGQAIGLLSMPEPGPLVALKTTDAFLIFGEWPNITVTKLSEGCGALRQDNGLPGAAACVTDKGAFWAGANNIYWYRGGGEPRQLLSGKLETIWHGYQATGANSYARVSAMNDCVFVAFSSGCWVYNIVNEAWSSWTNATFDFSVVLSAPDRSDVYVLDSNEIRSLFYTLVGVPGGSPTAAESGTFELETGEGIFSDIDERFRVIEAKLTYELYPSTARVTVGFGQGTFTTEATLSGTTYGTAPEIQTTIIRPSSGNFGTEVRYMRMKLTETVAAADFKLHDVTFIVRKMGDRR